MRTDQEPHPPSKQRFLTNLAISMVVITTIAIALRVWAKIVASRDISQRLWWDDILAFISFPINLTLLGISLYWIKAGNMGTDLALISMDQLLTTLKLMYIDSIFYSLSIAIPRFSVIFFYARIFHANATFIKYMWWLGAFMVVFFIQQTFFNVAPCFPIRKVWDPMMEGGWCFDYYKDWLAQSIGILILDLIILIAPLPALLGLNMNKKRKIQIIALFICAYSVVAIAIGRVVTIVKTVKNFKDNPTYAPVPFLSWCCVEASISLFSICLPNMFQLFQRYSKYGTRALFSRRQFSQVSAGSDWRAKQRNRSKPRSKDTLNSVMSQDASSSEDPVLEKMPQVYHANVSVGSHQTSSDDDIEPATVHVQSDAEVNEKRIWDKV